MSGGLPAAAFGGRAEVMERLAPLGPVYQAGTLSGNPVAVAAGLATLRAADDAVYAALNRNADRLAELLHDALAEAGVPHASSARGQHAQRVLRRPPGHRLRRRQGQPDLALPAVLPRAARRRRLPAAERIRNLVRLSRLDDEAFERIATALPAAARGRKDRTPAGGMMAETTTVHVMRHGEVHNPEGSPVRPAARLPPVGPGRAQAQAVADALADHDIVLVVASPLQRAQETAAPIAARHGLAVATDADLIESANDSSRAGVSRPATARCATRGLVEAAQPVHAVVGRAVRGDRARMMAAVDKARAKAAGHEAVVVSHQLPVETLRRYLDGKRLWHDPRKRQCNLASLTSLVYDGDDLVDIVLFRAGRGI